jgi:hypothetical protein
MRWAIAAVLAVVALVLLVAWGWIAPVIAG